MLGFLFLLICSAVLYVWICGLVQMVSGMLFMLAVGDPADAKPGCIWSAALVLNAPLGIAWGLYASRAFCLFAHAEPDRWTYVWYAIGFLFSVPLTQTGSEETPAGASLGIAAMLAYVLGVVFQDLPLGILDDFARYVAL